MSVLNRLTLTVAAAAIALAVSKPGLAETNILFILDGSNSMWGQVAGVAKIKTAQDVLTDLMVNLPKDTKVGLMVYGHRSSESCDDIELLSSIGADQPAELVNKIRSIRPTGKAPIANALLGSRTAFSTLDGQNNHVVLISDGIETCGVTFARRPVPSPMRASNRAYTSSVSMLAPRSRHSSSAFPEWATASTSAPPMPAS